MPGFPSGHAVEPDPERAESVAAPAASRSLGMIELAAWLRERIPELRNAWVDEIHRRGAGQSSLPNGVVEHFAKRLVDILPLMLGPLREQVSPLWDQGFELFGVVAAKRGLAAGEAIEEIHFLRELVIRDLYRDPPMGGTVPLSLREVIRLNRALDRAVTHASVGHTDALFFEFFEAEGGSEVLRNDDVIAEARAQLDALQRELDLIVGHKVASSTTSSREH